MGSWGEELMGCLSYCFCGLASVSAVYTVTSRVMETTLTEPPQPRAVEPFCQLLQK